MTEPPILKDLTDDGIKSFLDKPFSLKVPGNTQFVERLIKVITQKGCRAASPSLRDGITRATLKSQKQLPKCRTKNDFLALKWLATDFKLVPMFVFQFKNETFAMKKNPKRTVICGLCLSKSCDRWLQRQTFAAMTHRASPGVPRRPVTTLFLHLFPPFLMRTYQFQTSVISKWLKLEQRDCTYMKELLM